MAKRKKPVAKTAATRRTTRRGKQANSEAGPADGETSGTVEPPPVETNPDDKPSVSNNHEQPQQASTLPTTKPCQVPIVALHKKFGKYRCLFNNDDNFVRKCDVSSDSETNSSVEIRVVDPCASSESDSNAALDTQSDTNSGACLSPMNCAMTALQSQNSSRDISPVPTTSEGESTCKVPLLKENVAKEKKNLEVAPTIVLVEEVSNSEKQEISGCNEVLNVTEQVSATSQDISLAEQQIDQIEFADDDDEVITIVQIVEDDHPELYYNININSPKDDTYEETDRMKSTDIQRHFQNLNLASSRRTDSPMDFNDSLNSSATPCSTPDLHFSKDHLDALPRPDPSITPSSTLSDDSNSSRVTEHNQTNSNDSAESSPTGVRRSSRIKTISNLKQKTKGYGLVKTPLKKALITQTKLKLEEIGSDSQEKSIDMLPIIAPNSPSFPVPLDMPVKVKSRWRRSSELEMGASSPASSPLASPNLPQRLPSLPEDNVTGFEVVPLSKEAYDKIIDDRMKQYQHLDDNEYLCDRMISKETKKMTCDCFMTKEELERGELACGEDCLNRLLMIECNSRCPVGDRCTNRRFQKGENAALKVFYADKKGCGVEAANDIPLGEFLMEYVGEVLDYEQFYKRAQAYSDENNLHHYFMSLKGDTVIDATMKGNISRFINHSCDPNAETQKWTVNGELRIGFFSKRDIISGEEITFDYQFQRFGKVAQRCYCGASNCRGWIGAEPDSDEEDEEEDVSTSKTSVTEGEESRLTDASEPRPRPRERRRKYKPKAPDLVQDADIEEDLEALSRTGVKNQSHTLRLSRTVVRAKTRRAQTSLLRLLRDADLPCRRLFLDYRGLRLLAPWCTDAPLEFRLEMLQTVDRLPITNKTMVQESRFFTIVERWLSTADAPVENVFIDEATGLPVDLMNRSVQDNSVTEKSKEIQEKVKDLSSQLLERWSSLKEVFKIPKKERIQQMKEHERQANVERRAADSSGSRDRERERERRDERDRREERERREERDRREEREKEREREREKDRERERERERDRERERERDRTDRERDRYRERDRDDRDRRKRRSSPEGRRSIRLSERVLAAVPPMSKEERRRAFAEAAAAADDSRSRAACAPGPRWPPYWPQQDNLPPQMYPGALVGGGCEEWAGEYAAFCPPYAGPQPYCMPQHNLMGMGGFGMGGFMFGQQMPPFAPQPQPPLIDPSQPPPGMMPDPNIAMSVASASAMPSAKSSQNVVLPSMWRSAQDERGRTYYYHVKLRQPQWEPPTPPPPSPDESSSEEEEEPMSAIDTAIVRRQLKGKMVEGVNGIYEVIKDESRNGLIPDHALLTMKPRKRRPGLVSERPISPRTEEDKLAGRMEVKRYKQTKEKLRRRRERLVQRVRMLAARGSPAADQLKMVDLVDSASDTEDECEEMPALPEKPPSPVAVPALEAVEVVEAASSEEVARRIKEQFRSSMARVMVHHLNPYRHSDAPAGRITCTADFKHLARKLTHFVMLKELKHCRTVEELVVTDSVRSKAKMFVKKYMAKFGPVYKRPPEEAD